MTTDREGSASLTLRALYVTGPHGGARHLLPEGLVTLGRAADATIIVSDPRVSRSHAALLVESEIFLSDLGSANGTFLGDNRLGSGESRVLADGQAFFIGDSALVVRPCTLTTDAAKRVTCVGEVRERVAAAAGEGARLIAVRVRPLGPPRARAIEAILGSVLQSTRDFIAGFDDGEHLLGVEVSSEADAPRVERDVIRTLASFSLPADVSVRALSDAELERAGAGGLRALFSTQVPVTLARGKVVLEDAAMKALEQTVLRVAKTAVAVLILGETGAGKDVVATLLHETSPRASRPFVALNCASLPETLLESELFGYERGAFTGATTAKPGLLEAADGGTVFLDEVGDLPLALQAKLLRVLEAREVTRLGAVKPRPVDVRFVAATNRNLAHAVSEGRFRQDLYYRLNAVTLSVPPLRERAADVAPLARLFLESACARFETGSKRLSAASLATLTGHAWPGNVRELKGVVERAVLLAAGEVIEPRDFGLPLSDVELRASRPNPTEIDELAASDPERPRILRALEECGGNQSRAAKLLGVSRRTLVRKIAELGLPRPRS